MICHNLLSLIPAYVGSIIKVNATGEEELTGKQFEEAAFHVLDQYITISWLYLSGPGYLIYEINF